MTKKRFYLLVLLVGMFHIVLALSFGEKKEGFHEDEYYTYWSSTNEAGVMHPPNLGWYKGAELQMRYLVRPGEEFSYDTVVHNQEEDVHPPLYYMALHTFMSFFPGKFYKWFSILLNLTFSLVTYSGIVFFFYHLNRSKSRYLLALTAGLVYAVAPSTISSIMLNRMYALSTMWTVLYADIFILLIRNLRCNKRKFAMLLAGGAVTCYLAFLTHYFALLIPFLLTFFYCVYVLIKKTDVLRMLIYGVSMLISIGLAVCTYPASLSHIFGGYRGKDAVGGLLSSDLFGMVKAFWPYWDENLFAGMMVPSLVVLGIVLIAGAVAGIAVKKKGEQLPEISVYGYLTALISCFCGMWVLSKTALFLGADSSRYFYPVIGFLLPLMAYGVVAVLLGLINSVWENTENTVLKNVKRFVVPAVLILVVMIPQFAGFVQGKVLFLYEEEAEKKAFSEEYREYPAIMMFGADVPYRSWYVDDQLWPFEDVFFADYEHIMTEFEDEKLESADKIVVFMDAPLDSLDKLIANNPNLESYSLVRHDPFFYVYLLE